MARFRQYALSIILVIFLISICGVWYVVYIKGHQEKYLTVAFLDIGQGDSIYIEAPNGTQLLIDGGPGNKVISELNSVMPFGDRSLNLVLATHTDADHIGGLPQVLNRYRVGAFIDNGTTSGTKIFQKLKNTIKENSVKEITAHKGMRFTLDQDRNIYFDILFPDRDISKFESNDGSIVGRLVYGNESFLLTGDATIYTENLIMNSGQVVESDVLKLGHHGSHTSSSLLWLKKVHPEIAIISAGKNNRYGHPHQDILDRLRDLSIPYRATYKEGTIIFKTDGTQLIYN